MTYSPLPKSYKNFFPFTLSCPSYIYPDDLLTNVSMLAPYVDEIEILIFERSPLPRKDEINTLCRLADHHDLSFNIHFPLDLSIGAPDQIARKKDIDLIKNIIDLVAPLSASTYTLHIPFVSNVPFDQWLETIHISLDTLLSQGIQGNQISVETLDYPLSAIRNTLDCFDLSVCLDFGHIIRYSQNLDAVFHEFAPQTTIIHLSGVKHQKDHLPLDQFSAETALQIKPLLKDYTGILSLEVFTYAHLVASLFILESWFELRPDI